MAAGQALETLAIGTLLQGVLDPEGARWDHVIRTSIQLLVEGMAGPKLTRPKLERPTSKAARSGPRKKIRR